MSLHFHPVPSQSALNRETRSRLHKQLENELADEKISRELVEKNNRNITRRKPEYWRD